MEKIRTPWLTNTGPELQVRHAHVSSPDCKQRNEIFGSWGVADYMKKMYTVGPCFWILGVKFAGCFGGYGTFWIWGLIGEKYSSANRLLRVYGLGVPPVLPDCFQYVFKMWSFSFCHWTLWNIKPKYKINTLSKSCFWSFFHIQKFSLIMWSPNCLLPGETQYCL